MRWVGWTAVAAYFGVTGALALVAIAVPTLILAGYVLVVPGIALTLAPMAFGLGLATLAVAAPLRALRLPWWAAVPIGAAVVATAEVAVPLRVNQATWAAYADALADDRALPAPVALPSTLAIVEDDGPGTSPEGLGCTDLCLTLLYNGVVARVTTTYAHTGASEPPDHGRVRTFAVERRPVCPPAPIAHPLGDLGERIRGRIAAGSCLVEQDPPSPVEDAGLVVTIHRFGVDGPRLRPFALRRDTVTGRRYTLLANDHGNFTVLDRTTRANVRPLVVPLLVGPIVTWGMGVPEAVVGFERFRAGDGPIDLTPAERDARFRRWFGDAVRTPDPGVDPKDPRALAAIVGAALDAGAPAESLDAAELWLAALSRASLTPEDVTLLGRLIATPESPLGGLGAVVHAHGEALEPLAETLLRRTLDGDLDRDARGLSMAAGALRDLPPGSLAPHEALLTELTRTPIRRSITWEAVVRLADAGPAAVPVYTEVLDEVSDPRRGADRDSAVLHGVLIGLCRLGEVAAPTEDLLEAMVARGGARGTLSAEETYAGEVLVHLGASDRVKRALEGTRATERVSYILRRGVRDRVCEG